MAFSSILNQASFDPDFAIADVISSATKRARRNASRTETVIVWNYSIQDLALPDESEYIEERIDTGKDSYVLLRKEDFPDGTLRILSDKGNPDYTEAVRNVAAYYENTGYTVEIKEYSETMMLSLAHAEHFDLFLLREEEKE